MEEFYNIFGPELKAVTGDPKRIEDVVKRVDGLVKPLENVSKINLEYRGRWYGSTILCYFCRRNSIDLQRKHKKSLYSRKLLILGLKHSNSNARHCIFLKYIPLVVYVFTHLKMTNA